MTPPVSFPTGPVAYTGTSNQNQLVAAQENQNAIISDSPVISTPPQPVTEVTFLDVHTYIANRLQSGNRVWIHGDQTISELSLRIVPNNIQWIDAGETAFDLAKNWIQNLKQLRPEFKIEIPENYQTLFDQSSNRYLFVLTNVTVQHIKLIEELSHDFYDWVLISKKPMHEDSRTIVYNEESASRYIENEGADPQLLSQSFVYSPVSLSIAVMLHNRHRATFLDRWRAKLPQTNFVSFCLDFIEYDLNHFNELLTLANKPVDKRFYTDKLNGDVATLKDYHIIREEGDHFTLYEHIRNRAEHPSPETSLKTVFELSTKLFEYVGHNISFDKTWVVPHVIHLFRKYKENVKPDEVSSMRVIHLPLFWLMLKVGNLYATGSENCLPSNTHETGASLAKKISIDARDFLEALIKERVPEQAKRDLLFTKEEISYCIDTMQHIDANLGYLYVNLQYQIGRMYFYEKKPDDKTGSMSVLKYAQKMVNILDERCGHLSLLSKLIDRNGRLFHLSEGGHYDKAIEGYRELLDSEEVANIPGHIPPKIDLQKDHMFQTTCLGYLIHNLIQKRDLDGIDAYLDRLRFHIDKLDGKQKIRPLLNLLEGYHHSGKLEKMTAAIEELKTLELTTLNKLDVLGFTLKYHLGLMRYDKAAATALEYRELASKYYLPNSYPIYKYFFYEDVVFCTNHAVTMQYPSRTATEKGNVILVSHDAICKGKRPPTKYTIQGGILLIEANFQVLPASSNPKERYGKRGSTNTSLRNPSSKQRQTAAVSSSVKFLLNAGPNKLVLSKQMYAYICRQGEENELLETLANEKTFQYSKFGAAEGYRLRLEGSSYMSPRSRIGNVMTSFLASPFVQGMKKSTQDHWKQFAEEYANIKMKRVPNATIVVDELIDVVHKVMQIPIISGAKETEIRGNLVKSRESLHYSTPSTFAYHVIKHSPQRNTLFSPDNNTFDFHRFSEIARQYLQAARDLVVSARWQTAIPDQYEDDIVDHRFYSWSSGRSVGIIVLTNQQKIARHQAKIDNLTNESKNDLYFSGTRTSIAGKIDRQQRKIAFLEREIQNQVFKLEHVSMVAIREKKSSSCFYIKTYFSEMNASLESMAPGTLRA